MQVKRVCINPVLNGNTHKVNMPLRCAVQLPEQAAQRCAQAHATKSSSYVFPL